MKAQPSIEDLALPHVRSLSAYVPGKQPEGDGWVKLNTNENPYPPTPEVYQAVAKGNDEALRKYPNPISHALREEIARQFDLPGPEWVCVGNGSDDVLNLLIRAFCDQEHCCGYMDPSYSLYPVLVNIQGGKSVPVPYDESMDLPVDRIVECGANLFLLTSPNAPTGVGYSAAQVESLAKSFPGILVVDEAYAAFAKENVVGMLKQYPRMAVTRTFSKSHSLAGSRVGFILGHPELIDVIDRVRDSYNVNRLSQQAALAAIRDSEYYAGTTARIIEEREEFLAALEQWGWFTYPSQANFVFTRPVDREGRIGKAVAAALYEFLLGQKILVRYFPSYRFTEAFLRITIGTKDEMQTLKDAIDSWLKHA